MQRRHTEIVHAEYPVLLDICRRLRGLNEREIRGLWPDFTPERLARVVAQPAYSRVAVVAGEPAISFGIRPTAVAGEWSVWMFGTDDYAAGIRAACLHVRRNMIPWVLGQGMVKAECKSLVEDGTERFVRRMGGTPVRKEALGASGERYWTFRWLRHELEGR